MAPAPNIPGARALRIVQLVSFIPAFPMLITHGVLSQHPVPAVGLVPLFFSALWSIFLLSTTKKSAKGKQRTSLIRGETDDDGEEEEGAIWNEDEEGEGGVIGFFTHPIMVVLVDAVLATSLMVVLVIMWILTQEKRNPGLVLLSAYATMPLLVNFLIHVYLGIRGIAAGLALHALIQWTAWRAVPPDCPHCGNRLRPDSLPKIPWYESISAPRMFLPMVSVPSVSRPSFPTFKGPSGWKIPRWLKRGSGEAEYARLFADDRSEHDHEHGHDEYRDSIEEGPAEITSSTIAVATGAVTPTPPAVEEVVVGKKDKKKSGSSPALYGDDPPTW